MTSPIGMGSSAAGSVPLEQKPTSTIDRQEEGSAGESLPHVRQAMLRLGGEGQGDHLAIVDRIEAAKKSDALMHWTGREPVDIVPKLAINNRISHSAPANTRFRHARLCDEDTGAAGARNRGGTWARPR